MLLKAQKKTGLRLSKKTRPKWCLLKVELKGWTSLSPRNASPMSQRKR
uniref:Uncharacterized protein n=1 Tax=Megaselia scalaris TaxID=36166 RepID=T1GLX4_MEGSC